MEVLITGGNGFVGRHLSCALLARSDRVRVLALPGEDVRWLEGAGVQVHRGDILERETLRLAVEGVDAVLHLAAMMHVWRPLDAYRAVNVTGTGNVCKAVLDARVRRLVHISSTCVYGSATPGPFDEGSRLAPPPDPYPVTKAEGDRLVQRMINQHGLPAVILRPDQIFGPGDRLHFGQTAARLEAGRGIIVGSGHNALPLVYVSDVIDAILMVLDDADVVGETINITNDQPLSQREFLAEIAEGLGVRPPRVHVPFAVLYAAASVAEAAAHATRTQRRPPLTRLGVSFLGRDVHCSLEKARRFGFYPRADLKEGVRRTVAWYRSGATAVPILDSTPRPMGREV